MWPIHDPVCSGCSIMISPKRGPRFTRKGPSPKTGPLRSEPSVEQLQDVTASLFTSSTQRPQRLPLAKCEQVSLHLILKFRSQSAWLSESRHCGSPQPHFKPPVCGSSGPRDTTGNQKTTACPECRGKTTNIHKWNQPSTPILSR